MKRTFRLLLSGLLLVSLATPLLADTIRLKDGSVIRGQVIGFKDQQFTILIGGNAKGRRGQTTVYVEDVESIEFDSTPGGPANVTEESTARNNPPPAMRPSNTNNQAEPVASDSRTIDPKPASSSTPTFFTIKVPVRADAANNGWTNSGLVVRKGQRLRISASGRVSLGRGRFSTPSGVSVLDDQKLMRNEATGALIAVIGDDNDDFIMIGPRREFVAQRDGVLFLGVNEGDLSDNTGSYDIVIEAEASGR
jgi:hypothetical protein